MRTDGAVIRCPARVPDFHDAPHAGVLWRAAPGRLLFDVPDVARYLVSDGKLVEVEPRPGADAGSVRRFLRMTPRAALYLQRGIPVLHAAVAVDAAGRAVVLAGDSGSGKSALLATLVRRGWRRLADDLAPVTLDSDRVPVAVPTWPEIREPRPVSAIWWLGIHGGDGVEVRAIEGIGRFEAFGAMAYNSLIAAALLDRGSYLAVAGTVASAAIPIRRLLRPRDQWTADELACLVEDARHG
jgi:hypothetical protein